MGNIFELTFKSKLVMNLRHYSDIFFQTLISSEEMFRISKEISRNYSPVAPLVSSIKKVDIPLSPQELKKVSDNISLYYSPKPISNNTNLSLLAIDPNHLYIYWNLANNQAISLLHTMHSNELMLRIYSLLEQDKAQVLSKPVFEMPIHKIQFQQEIEVPNPKKQTVYLAYIGKCLSEKNFVSLVKSNDLHVDAYDTTHSKKSAFNENPIKLMNINQFNSANLYYASSNQSGTNNKFYYA